MYLRLYIYWEKMSKSILKIYPLRRQFCSSNILWNGNYSHLKLTFFEKPSCGLCDNAKEVIDDVLNENEEFSKAGIAMKIININKYKHWWDRYCFDIPVLHIENDNEPNSLIKIMHFFKEDELIETLKRFKR